MLPQVKLWRSAPPHVLSEVHHRRANAARGSYTTPAKHGTNLAPLRDVAKETTSILSARSRQRARFAHLATAVDRKTKSVDSSYYF